MKNSKKGFTLVELLVVIAILAILATVAVVGYTSFTRKADISNDTVIAGELNTLLAATDVTDPIESFDDVKAALYANGFYLANLNTKTEGCYFVWDAKNNQIILVDGNDGFKVLFSKVTPSEDKKDWYFAVSDLSKVAAIETAGYNVEKMVTDIANLAGALAAGGEFHIDKSLVLTNDNRILVTEDVDMVINLGNSTLNSDGTIQGQPIQIKAGTVVINGGVVGGTGESYDIDGKLYSSSIRTYGGSTVEINGTELNADPTAGILFGGTSVLNNTKSNTYYYTYCNGQTTLNNCVNDVNDTLALWVTNTNTDEGHSNGTATMTVNGGVFTNKKYDATYGTASVLGGTLNLNKVELNSVKLEDGSYSALFYVGEPDAKIVINGGTFNGVAFEELDTVDEWKALCAGDYTVVISDGVVTITK